MSGSEILQRLRDRFAVGVVEAHEHRGDATAVVDRGALLDDEPTMGFDMLMDLTAADYLRYPGREDGPRFEVVYLLHSLPHNHRVRLKVRVDEDDAVVPSAVDLWPIANWLEREVWDMFGVRFAGHPDLRRLLMYEEFVGHPLRKDYPINRRQPLIGPKA
jgi:NADH-quinone oxidoreductase subunit C